MVTKEQMESEGFVLIADVSYIMGLLPTETAIKWRGSDYLKDVEYVRVEEKDLFHNEEKILWDSCLFPYEYYKKGMEILRGLGYYSFEIFMPSNRNAPMFIDEGRVTLAIAPQVFNNEPKPLILQRLGEVKQ